MMTRHAETRSQQRAIRTDVIDVLVGYGKSGHHQGAEVFYMDKAARAAVRRDLGEDVYRRLADKLGSYVVISPEGRIITVGRRTRRLKF